MSDLTDRLRDEAEGFEEASEKVRAHNFKQAHGCLKLAALLDEAADALEAQAKVERAAAAKALRDAADEIFVEHGEITEMTRSAFHRGADAVYDALRARAERMENE